MARTDSEVTITAKWQDKASKGLQQLQTQLAKGLKVAALAAAAGIVALTTSVIALTRRVANLGDEIQKMGLRTGASTEFLSGLSLAARLSGESLQTIEHGVRRLARNMYDAQEGIKAAQEAFDKLGISIHDDQGELRQIEDIFLEVADAMQYYKNETEATAIAQEIFGRGGAALLPLLKQGSEAIREQMLEARELGIVWSQESADAAAKFNDELLRLRLSFQGLYKAIGEQLLPAFTPLITRLRDYVVANREAVERGAERFAEAIQRLVDRIDWDDLRSKIEDLAKIVRDFGEWCWTHRDFLAKAFVVTSIAAITLQLARLADTMKILGATSVMKFFIAHPAAALALGSVAAGGAVIKHFRSLFEERWSREAESGGGGGAGMIPIVGQVPTITVEADRVRQVNNLLIDRKELYKDVFKLSFDQEELEKDIATRQEETKRKQEEKQRNLLALGQEIHRDAEALVDLEIEKLKVEEEVVKKWYEQREVIQGILQLVDQLAWRLGDVSEEIGMAARSWSGAMRGLASGNPAQAVVSFVQPIFGGMIDALTDQMHTVEEYEAEQARLNKRLFEATYFTGQFADTVKRMTLEELESQRQRLEARLSEEARRRGLPREMRSIYEMELQRVNEAIQRLTDELANTGDEIRNTTEALSGYTSALTEQQKALIRAEFHEREIALRGRFARQVLGLRPSDPAYQFLFHQFRSQMGEIGRQLDLALQHGTQFGGGGGGTTGASGGLTRELVQNTEILKQLLQSRDDFSIKWDEGVLLRIMGVEGDKIIVGAEDIFETLEPTNIEDWSAFYWYDDTTVKLSPEIVDLIELGKPFTLDDWRLAFQWDGATKRLRPSWSFDLLDPTDILRLSDWSVAIGWMYDTGKLRPQWSRDILDPTSRFYIDDWSSAIYWIPNPGKLRPTWSEEILDPVSRFYVKDWKNAITWSVAADKLRPTWAYDVLDPTSRFYVNDWSSAISWSVGADKLRPHWSTDILNPVDRFYVVDWSSAIAWSVGADKLRPRWSTNILDPTSRFYINDWSSAIFWTQGVRKLRPSWQQTVLDPAGHFLINDWSDIVSWTGLSQRARPSWQLNILSPQQPWHVGNWRDAIIWDHATGKLHPRWSSEILLPTNRWHISAWSSAIYWTGNTAKLRPQWTEIASPQDRIRIENWNTTFQWENASPMRIPVREVVDLSKMRLVPDEIFDVSVAESDRKMMKVADITTLVPDTITEWEIAFRFPESPQRVPWENIISPHEKLSGYWTNVIAFPDAPLSRSWSEILSPHTRIPKDWTNIVAFPASPTSKVWGEVLYIHTPIEKNWTNIVDFPDSPVSRTWGEILFPHTRIEKSWQSMIEFPDYPTSKVWGEILYPHTRIVKHWVHMIDFPDSPRSIPWNQILSPSGAISPVIDLADATYVGSLPPFGTVNMAASTVNVTGGGGEAGAYQYGGVVDSIYARLTRGEYVMPVAQTSKNIGALEAMRAGTPAPASPGPDRGSSEKIVINIQAWDSKDVKRWFRGEGRQILEKMDMLGKVEVRA